MTLTIAHSTPEPETIAALVGEHWDIGPIVECTLERAWTNDVYRIRAASDTWFLKLARRSWREPSDVAWEARLIAHLAQSGLPVSAPVPTYSGDLTLTVSLPEGDRAATLSPQLGSQRPPKPPTEATYIALGNLAARLHDAMDTFEEPCPRPVNNAAFLVTDALPIIRSRIPASQSNSAGLEDLATTLAAHLERADLAMGLCHLDLTLDNVRFADDGQLYVFDFDLSAPSWRAREGIGVFIWSVKSPSEAAPYWPAWLEGYRSIRSFPEIWETLMPAIAAADEFYDLAHTIRYWEHWTGRWMTEQMVRSGKVESILAWEHRL